MGTEKVEEQQSAAGHPEGTREKAGKEVMEAVEAGEVVRAETELRIQKGEASLRGHVQAGMHTQYINKHSLTYSVAKRRPGGSLPSSIVSQSCTAEYWQKEGCRWHRSLLPCHSAQCR